MRVFLGRDLTTGQPVTVGDEERCGGLYILGKPRTGKSNVLLNLALQDAQYGQGLLFIDPHADAITEFLARLPANRVRDVILLDPQDVAYPFGINLLACPDPSNLVTLTQTYKAAMDIFIKVFGDAEGNLGIWLEKYLHNSIYGLLENPGYTLADIPLLLTNRPFRQHIAGNMRVNLEVAEFWAQAFDRLTKHDREEQVESTLTRLNAVLGHPIVKHIVGQTRNTLDFADIMNAGESNKIVLLKMSRRLPPRVQTLLGTLLISQVLQAAQAREDISPQDRRYFSVYCDEFQHFATPDFAKLFTETGKNKLMPTVAHQERVGQFTRTDPNRGATLAAANKLLFGLSVLDSEELAPEVAREPEPERIEELVKEEIVGRRAVKTFKREVVEHLLRTGHEDTRVMQWVSTYLRPLNEYSHRFGRHNPVYSLPSYLFENGQEKPTYSSVFQILNDWLYGGMRERAFLWQKLPEPAFLSLVYFFGYLPSSLFPGLDHVYGTIYRPPLAMIAKARLEARKKGTLWEVTEGTLQALIDVLIASFPAWAKYYTSIWDGYHSLKGLNLATAGDLMPLWQRLLWALDRIDAALATYATAHPTLGMADYTRFFKSQLAPLGIEVFLLPALSHGFNAGSLSSSTLGVALKAGVYRKHVYTHTLQLLQWYLTDFYHYQQLRASLLLAQLGLCETPIMTTESGMFEKDVRTQTHYITHPQRSYTDMQAEMAQELANLPRFTAWAKLVQVRGSRQITVKQKLQTLPLPPAYDPGFVAAREAQIREQTHREYCLMRETVEEEIRQRQAPWRQTPGNDTPPPRQRPGDIDEEPPSQRG